LAAVQILNSEVALTSKTPEIKFGSIDYFGIDEPFAWAPGEAWVVREGTDSWVRVEDASVGMDGRVLSKAAFDAMFPSVPPLPSKAFQRGFIPDKAAE
jgi:hypothetical protein